MAELAAAGIFAAGSYGARRLYQYQKRVLGNSTAPARTMAISQSNVNSARLDYLSRRVARISPAVENIVTSRALTAAASSTTTDDFSFSSSLPSSAEMGTKYVGDKWRNLKLQLRFNCSESLNAVRVVVYKPYTTGDSASGTDLQNVLDPSKFRVYYDTLAFPAHGNQMRKNFIRKDIPLNFITQVDRTAPGTATVKLGELRVITIMENTTATARSVSQFYMLKFQNK